MVRKVLTDNYAHVACKYYQTIPHGVALPHREDVDPKKKSFMALISTGRGKSKKIIKPKQQVESLIVEATNALSTGGQAQKVRQTAAMMYLDIEKELHELPKKKEEFRQDVEKTFPFKLEEIPTASRNDMMLRILDQQLIENKLMTKEELKGLSIDERMEDVLKQLPKQVSRQLIEYVIDASDSLEKLQQTEVIPKLDEIEKEMVKMLEKLSKVEGY